jgi:transposase-like protein
MKENKRPELKKSETIARIPLACANEAAAVEFLEEQRWGKNPTCPHCGSANVYKMLGRGGKTPPRNKRFLWRCRECSEQYTVRIGTVYEDSRLPLKHWCYAFWRAASSKKGVSALEIKRHCQISYKSALFLMHRVRFAMTPDQAAAPKMDGTCEADETYIGGKPRNNRGGKQFTGYRKDSNKIPVAVLVNRDTGEARTEVMEKVNAVTVAKFLGGNIEKSATLNTDQSQVYSRVLSPVDIHQTVNHSLGEYVRYNDDGTVAGINVAESFFSLLKRGLTGTFHSVSKKHLHRYCAEFAFRWNSRKLNDGARTSLAIQSAQGKRLMYKQSTAA